MTTYFSLGYLKHKNNYLFIVKRFYGAVWNCGSQGSYLGCVGGSAPCDRRLQERGSLGSPSPAASNVNTSQQPLVHPRPCHSNPVSVSREHGGNQEHPLVPRNQLLRGQLPGLLQPHPQPLLQPRPGGGRAAQPRRGGRGRGPRLGDSEERLPRPRGQRGQQGPGRGEDAGEAARPHLSRKASGERCIWKSTSIASYSMLYYLHGMAWAMDVRWFEFMLGWCLRIPRQSEVWHSTELYIWYQNFENKGTPEIPIIDFIDFHIKYYPDKVVTCNM